MEHAPTQLFQRSPRIRIPTRPSLILVPYGLYMGMAAAALMFTSFVVAVQSPEDTGAITTTLSITLFYAIAGARLLSILFDDGMPQLLSRPLRTIFRPGFWLYGGILGAATGALLAQHRGYVPNMSRFAASLAVGLPLDEFFGRLGCASYGCCYGAAAGPNGRPTHFLWRLFPFSPAIYRHPSDYAVTRAEPKLLNEPLIPIQRISATIFLILFACISVPLACYSTAQIAGAVTLLGHAAVRVMTETCRADYRGPRHGGLTTTGKMALLEAMAALVWLGYERTMPVDRVVLDWSRAFEAERMRACAIAAGVGIALYGVHVDQIGTWVPKRSAFS
ncbi:Prolipo protein diacylglyceryl transferase-domain-containing protein [Mycena rebaudengoi]|nr:Prolipo protein diacylglyceryl transferase-domain-containing protein [Mycena rebaudengoi]